METDLSKMSAPQEAQFETPIDFVVWASRVYLYNVSQCLPIPDYLEERFREARQSDMYAALIRALSVLRDGVIGNLPVHEPNCPCTPEYEQALIMSIRALQNRSYEGYVAALSSILRSTAIRSIYPDMQLVAHALVGIERSWPQQVTKNQTLPANVVPIRPAITTLIH